MTLTTGDLLEVKMIFSIFERAKNIGFNKKGTGLSSTNVQDAIVEVHNEANTGVPSDYLTTKKVEITIKTGDVSEASAYTEISLSGYTPIAVAAWRVMGTNTYEFGIRGLNLSKVGSADRLTVDFANILNNGDLSCTVEATVLYKKG